MGKDFWLNRWNKGEIGWHQSEVEPALKKWISNRKPKRVLVPLCGKSLDMIWLHDHGDDVVGIELSSIACDTFFKENKIPFVKINHAEFEIYQGKGITIINGDIFSLTPELVGDIEAVYDRAALIALPPQLRVRYAQKLLELLGDSCKKENFEMLEIVLDRSTKDLEGPPYSVSPDEVQELYGQAFNVELLDKYKVEARGPEGSQTEECVLLLKFKN